MLNKTIKISFINNNNNNNSNNNNRSLFHKINIHIPCHKIVTVKSKLRYMKWQLKSNKIKELIRI